MKCGYDQRANVVREVETGVVEVPAPAAGAEGAAGTEEKVFVTPGRLSPKVLGIIGGVLTVCAMVATGVWAPRGAGMWLVIGLILLTLYQIALHTATGLGAVAIAARLEGEKLGRGDFALARIFVAFSLFEVLTRVRLPSSWLIISGGIPWLLAAAAYFGAILILFKKDRATGALIALAHAILWALLNAGMELSGLVAAAPMPKG
jgi:hypothetical protein